MLHSVGTKPKVYRKKMLFVCSTCHPVPPLWQGDKPWIVQTCVGSEEFETWQQACNYAASFRIIIT